VLRIVADKGELGKWIVACFCKYAYSTDMNRKLSSRGASDARQFSQIDPDFFKALGDPVRLALVSYMAHLGKPSTVTEVSGCCGIDFSGVSRHLKILREAGIVTATKRGRKTYYALDTRKSKATLNRLAEILGNISE